MYIYSYSNLDKLRWLAETLKKGSPFRQDINELPLRSYQLWKKTFYEETHKIDDMTELPKSPPKKTYKEDLESEIVMVKIPRCMAWLGSTNAYDEPIGSLEVEETLGTTIEVEPLDHMKLEDLGLNIYNHNIPLSFRKVPGLDEPESQSQPLPSCPYLDISLGDQRGPEPPIKPQSPGNFKMKVVESLTIHMLPLPHVAYSHPGLGDLNKYYGFKPGLLGQSGSLGVDFSNLEMIEDVWELKSKEVSFLGRGLNLPVRPKEVEKVKIKDTRQLEHIIQQPLFQHIAHSYHNGV
ncbi:hypothetical protein Tco_0842488 [Tanacetum coccineum]|uniref:Uncharacterized protein n=1 Tax=Tanacetum coccineum TaxID=301880 RepID=A0ABQ5B3K4_9ASTR